MGLNTCFDPSPQKTNPRFHALSQTRDQVSYLSTLFLSLSFSLFVCPPASLFLCLSSIPSNIFNLRGEVMHAGEGYVAWWLISRFVAFRSKDRGFESISSRHIWSLG